MKNYETYMKNNEKYETFMKYYEKLWKIMKHLWNIMKTCEKLLPTVTQWRRENWPVKVKNTNGTKLAPKWHQMGTNWHQKMLKYENIWNKKC